MTTKDMAADSAIAEIKKISDAEKLRAFLDENEKRKTVVEAFDARMKELPPPTPKAMTEAKAEIPTGPKDTTEKWVKDYPRLQPKDGEVRRITETPPDTGLKIDVIRKSASSRTLTIRDGAPCWIYFDEKGKEIGLEKVPGH